MADLEITESIRRKFQTFRPFLDERARRVWAAAEAAALGRGGVTLVARATGLARSTLYEGQRELRELGPATPPARRVRRPGGGAKRRAEKDAGLLPALEALVDPLARGDPESPLRWTTKSTRKLAATL